MIYEQYDLCAINKCNHFISDLGAVAKPLRILTVLLIKGKEKAPFLWAQQLAGVRMLPKGVQQHTVILRRSTSALYTMVNQNRAQQPAPLF